MKRGYERFEWDERKEEILKSCANGCMSNRTIARRLGTNETVVAKKRDELGLKPSMAGAKWRD